MTTAIKEQLLDDYRDMCALINDCSRCPLCYNPPQIPHCEYEVLLKEVIMEEEE